jgi:16S rRNA (uracil1498-N3)-methyltransferase
MALLRPNLSDVAMRPKIRLFVESPLEPGIGIDATAGQAHYLRTVMRRAAGDPVLLFNGRHGEWTARLDATGRQGARLEVEHRVRDQVPEPGPSLLFAPIRRARLEVLIEKATELGVAALIPLRTRRAVVDRLNSDRLRAIMIEAAEQSGRLSLPEVRPLGSIEDALSWPATGRPLLVGDGTGGGAPLAEVLRAHGPGDLLIGPEGGFAPEELSCLAAAPGVIPVSLGPLVLRAETAAIAALAIVRAITAMRDGSSPPRPAGCPAG